MFIQKFKYIWIINAILFIGIVFMGIEQAGKGAEVVKFEKDYGFTIDENQKLTDEILLSESNVVDFVKPAVVYYFDVEKVTANLSFR